MPVQKQRFCLVTWFNIADILFCPSKYFSKTQDDLGHRNRYFQGEEGDWLGLLFFRPIILTSLFHGLCSQLRQNRNKEKSQIGSNEKKKSQIKNRIKNALFIKWILWVPGRCWPLTHLKIKYIIKATAATTKTKNQRYFFSVTQQCVELIIKKNHTHTYHAVRPISVDYIMHFAVRAFS